MSKKFDTTMTECNSETFNRVKEVMWSHRGKEVGEKLEELFESGVPANGFRTTRDGTRYTYLSLAFQSGNHHAKEYLVWHNYKELVEFGWTFSQYLPHQNVAQALLDVGHSFADEIADPDCPFWGNAGGCSVEFFKTIAQRGANLNQVRTTDGVACPIIVSLATFDSTAGFVEKLLAAGVDHDARKTGGSSLLHAAVTQGQDRHSKELNSAEYALRLQRIAQALVAAGGSLDMVDDQGQSALHLACKLGYLDKTKVLIEAGANSRLQDKNGKSPEDLAKGAKRRDIQQMFAAMHARSTIMNVVAQAAASSSSTAQP